MMNIERPSYGGASGWVTAITMRNDAIDAKEAEPTRPSMTHSSPSWKALVVNTFGSAPPCGLVIEKQETIRLSNSG